MQHLLVLVDALGWLTVERTGFLTDLLPHRRRLTTVFGYSSTAIPSLLTGVRPVEHGHWFLFRRARGRSPFKEARWIARLPGGFKNRWRVRTRLQEYWRAKARIRGYFSLYAVPYTLLPELEPVEVADTWAPGAFPGIPTLVDHLQARGDAYHLSDWRVSDAEKIEAASRAVQRDAPGIVLLYLTGIDAMQHRVGTDHPDLDRALEDLDRALRGLLDRMRAHGPVATTLFSDHGMTDIETVRDLFAELAASGLRRGRDYSGFLDSTIARFWGRRSLDALPAALARIGWGRVLDEETLQRWGVLFPGREYGDLFFLADPGTLICPSDMGAAPLAAMHGYDPAHPTSDACLLSDHPVPLEAEHITAVVPALRRQLAQEER